jgi:2,4-dienoyl-CoA reductase (NADPH2)
VSAETIFRPLQLGPLTIKNRILRSSVGGRFDNYDGSGTQVRIDWDAKFARGGVGAVIASNAPVDSRGLMVPGYAFIDTDRTVAFWREVARRVHEHDCAYIVQLVHAGRERILPGLEYEKGLSATSKPDPLNGYPSERMSAAQIAEVVRRFADGARRAREAGADGVEVTGANGVLFTQFLSSAVNDRKDEYGGPLEHRARFVLDVVRGIRAEVGPDFCLGFKLSVREALGELLPWFRDGNTVEESVRVCTWLEEAGVDYLHVSAGGAFPHPRNPAGSFPIPEVVASYDTMLSSGTRTSLNYLMFRTWGLNRGFRWWWERPARRRGIEGINLPESRAVKAAVGIPVLCTGGFQTASVIAAAIERGDCDAVTIARPLVANPELVRIFADGHDRPPRPCTYCNRCVFSFLEHPLGCYEPARYDSREQMVDEVLSVYRGAPLPSELA